MNVIIDFGTSRTAIGVTDNQWGWQGIQKPASSRDSGPGWLAMSNLINGVTNLHLGTDATVPYMITYSSYCKIGNLVIPISIAGTSEAIVFPAGCEVVPPLMSQDVLVSQDAQFVSIKENQKLARSFLGALTEMVRAVAPRGADWVIGQTCRSIVNPGPLELPPGTRVFNEAAAVIFALVWLAGGSLVTDRDKFIVLADLGGGFLDVSVAHNVVLGERQGSAEIVNYGSYPIGVDRISSRFATSPITNPEALVKLIVTTIAYHIWDYGQKTQQKIPGAVFLTGGGFKRIDNAHRRISDQLITLVTRMSRIDVTVDPHAAGYDTKHLTLAGLARMAKVGEGKIALGDDISSSSLRYGEEILMEQSIRPTPEVFTWWSLLQSELRTAYYK